MKHVCVYFLLLVSHWVLAEPVSFEEVTFSSHQSVLSGTIAMPNDQKISAAVIFVHGSGKQTRYTQLAERFAENGIAALVYDKRGVGKSAGTFEDKNPVSESNLSLLADDASAALKVLEGHPKLQNIPLGMTGLSQAGWIVPLAAVNSGATDFIVLWSGPVTKVSEEDILSKHTKDQDSSKVPSYAEALAARTRPYVWPKFLGKDTDSMESLKQIDIPGLWVFGEKDGSIPVDLSIENIKRLNQGGRRFEYVLFSNEGHMNIKPSISMVIDWIKSLPSKR